jgi:hypothetical protein
MSITLEPDFNGPPARIPRRSRWPMRLLRAAPFPFLAGFLVGMAILSAGLLTNDVKPRADTLAPLPLCWIGLGLLGGCAALFFAVIWAVVCFQVVEGSRGLPVPEPIDGPKVPRHAGNGKAALDALQGGLAGLGFEPAGWFYLDNFAMLQVGAWRHCSAPAVAFVLYEPGGAPRLRFVRRFPDGAVLVSSTRLTDLAPTLPGFLYVQVRKPCSPADLWSWHLEAETLFTEQAVSSSGDERVKRAPEGFTPGLRPPSCRVATSPAGGSDPMEVFLEVRLRWARHIRSRRLWPLRFNLFRECWLMYWLSGLSLRQQIAEGWALAPQLRRLVRLAPEGE